MDRSHDRDRHGHEAPRDATATLITISNAEIDQREYAAAHDLLDSDDPRCLHRTEVWRRRHTHDSEHREHRALFPSGGHRGRVCDVSVNIVRRRCGKKFVGGFNELAFRAALTAAGLRFDEDRDFDFPFPALLPAPSSVAATFVTENMGPPRSSKPPETSLVVKAQGGGGGL